MLFIFNPVLSIRSLSTHPLLLFTSTSALSFLSISQSVFRIFHPFHSSSPFHSHLCSQLMLFIYTPSNVSYLPSFPLIPSYFSLPSIPACLQTILFICNPTSKSLYLSVFLFLFPPLLSLLSPQSFIHTQYRSYTVFQSCFPPVTLPVTLLILHYFPPSTSLHSTFSPFHHLF